MACHITVLGDSSSSGIGLGRDCYPTRLTRILGDEREVHVFNSAVPGFTSADASRLFRAVAPNRPLDYLIIYLGNNEGAVGVRKGYYRPFRTGLAERFSGTPDRTFRPVLSPPRFRFSYEVGAATIATTPVEFRDNLRSIVRGARRRGAEVIMLNPIANRRFPCGLGATNNSYFCYLDPFDRLGDALVHEPIDEATSALAAGVRSFAAGRLAEAIDWWEPLLPRADVAGFIARHNLACARARQGEDGAESQFRALVGEYQSYDSTVLFNLATLKRTQGEDETADGLFDAAYEKDGSIYRIRREYRDVIASFASVNGVRVIDLEPILSSAHFVDYCHPTDEGHEVIARAVADVIRGEVEAPQSVAASSTQLFFPTPDYRHHPDQTLVDYYCIDWPFPPDRIARAVRAAIRNRQQRHEVSEHDDLDACVTNFLRANDCHPVFTGHLDLLGAWAPRSYEILSCPEQFLYRVLYNYTKAFEDDRLLRHLSAGPFVDEVRLSAADYRRIVLRTSNDELDTPLDITQAYVDAIVQRVRNRLSSSDRIFRVTIGQRIRSVMTWFTREALRFGTQSRMSMLYARGDLDAMIEGLVVAIVIAERRGEIRRFAEIDTLMSLVLSLLQVHERHVRLYHHDRPSFSVCAYQSELADLEHSIRGCLER